MFKLTIKNKFFMTFLLITLILILFISINLISLIKIKRLSTEASLIESKRAEAYGESIDKHSEDVKNILIKQKEIIRFSIYRLLIISSFIFLFGLLPSAMSKTIISHLHKLVDYTNEVAKGNLNVSIKLESQDEIGELASSFNQMTEDLQKTTVSRDLLAKEVAERKKVEEALRETEEKYRMQFEGAMDAIFVADAETGILIDLNPAAAKLVGREKSELIGQHQRILHPPEEIEGEFSKTFKQHLKEKLGEALEAQVITKSGEIKYVAIMANLIEVRGRKVLQGIFRDITDRKKIEEQQRQLMKDLEETNKIMVGRELKMVELKREVNRLSQDLGRQEPYDLSSLERAE